MATPDLTAAIRTGLPGLASFDLGALTVSVNHVVKRIRITLAKGGELKIRRLALNPPLDPEEIEKVSSSALKKNGQASDLITGGQIHTRKRVRPVWELVFKNPREVKTIRVRAGRNFDVTKLAELRVESLGEFGEVLEFGNTDAVHLAVKAKAFQKSATVFEKTAMARRPKMKPLAAAFRAAADALVAGLAGEDTGSADGLARLDEMRLATLGRLVKCLRAVRAPDIERVYPDAKPVLAALISRGMPSDESSPTSVETEATALLFTTLLLGSKKSNKRRKVSNHLMYAFRKHFWAEVQLAALEKLVTGTMKKALRRRANPPYMMRVHGLSGPTLQVNAEKYLNHMTALQTALGELGYRSCISYGTLLGAVREKDFIEHDDDVDMAIVMRTDDHDREMVDLLTALKARGFKGYEFRSPALLSVSTARNKFPIDLFPIIDKGDHVRMYMEGMKVRPLAADLMLPLATIEFKGREYGAPSRPEAFLEDRYGADWRTPVRKVAHEILPTASDS